MKSPFYVVFIIALFSCFSSFSQTKNELEQQRKKLNREIAQVNRLLFNEQKKEKNVLEDCCHIKCNNTMQKKWTSILIKPRGWSESYQCPVFHSPMLHGITN